MSEIIKDANLDAHGLENLPKEKRDETEEILAEIQKEEDAKNPKPKEIEKPQKSEEEIKKEAEDKIAADKKIEEDKIKSGDEGSKDKSRRVPSYVLGIEKSRAEKREQELLKEIETLKATANPDGNNKKDIPLDAKTIVDKIVADHNVEDPKVIEDIMLGVQELLKNNKQELPADLSEKLKVVDDLKNQHEIAIEELNFNNDFDKNILPAIKAEYGDDIPVEKIADIRAKLKAIAYTPEYVKIPYDEIYSGKKDFRNLYVPSKRSAEGGRTSVDMKPGEKVFEGELSADEYNKLNPDDQQKYEDAMAKKEKNRG